LRSPGGERFVLFGSGAGDQIPASSPRYRSRVRSPGHPTGSRPTGRTALTRISTLRRAGRLPDAVETATFALEAAAARSSGPNRALEAAVRFERGRVFALLADDDTADDDFAAAARIARSIGLDALAGRAIAGRAAIARSAGRLEDASSLAGEAVALTAIAGPDFDPVSRSEALLELGLTQLEHDVASAVANLDEAVATAETGEPGREREGALAMALDGRANAHRVAGDFAAARNDLRRALRLTGRAFGRESVEVAQIRNDDGVVSKFAGDFDAAETAYREALVILERVLGPDHPEVAAVLHNVAGLAHARGRFAEAEEPARRSVEVRERALGTDHVAVALDRAGLAAILDRLGRSDEAEALLEQVLPVLRSTLGPRHREVAVTLNNLAAIAQARGDLGEAERLYRESLAIKAEAIGESSPSVGITLNNLATVLRRRGQLDSAESTYERAITVLAASVAPDHPALVAARSNLAAVRSRRR
jgi:tetratricopeptide (TPR) repeat protein